MVRKNPGAKAFQSFSNKAGNALLKKTKKAAKKSNKKAAKALKGLFKKHK